MIVRRQSKLAASAGLVWQIVLRTSTLSFVASPLLTFQRRDGQLLPLQWSQGQTIDLVLFLFGFIPLGRHQIQASRVDSATRTLETEESGRLLRSWRHSIRVRPVADNESTYEDEVSIDAGFLTLPVWLGASIFYWHRHRRWRRLVTSLPIDDSQ